MFKLLSFLALYLPFQVALSPGEDIDLASIRIIILGIFFLWLVEGLRKRRLTLEANWTTLGVTIFLFLNLISLFWAQNWEWSVRKLAFLFSIFPLYFVVSDSVRNVKSAIGIAKKLVLGASLASVLGIFQFFSQFIFSLESVYQFWAKYLTVPFLGKAFSMAVLANPSWLVNIGGETFLRATAVFPDPHMFSFFLGMCAPIAFSLAMESSSRKRKWFLGAGFLMLIADILTFSRGGYLGLVVGITFVIIFFWGKWKKSYRWTAGGLVFLVIAFVLVFPLSRERFFSTFNLKEGSNQGRMATWRQAQEIIRSNPVKGVGIGNYPLEIKATASYREPIYAHSTYLDVAAETGVVNLVVWIGILAGAVIVCLKKAKKNYLFLGLSLSLIVFGTHALVETPIYSPVILSVFLIILALANVKVSNEQNN